VKATLAMVEIDLGSLAIAGSHCGKGRSDHWGDLEHWLPHCHAPVCGCKGTGKNNTSTPLVSPTWLVH